MILNYILIPENVTRCPRLGHRHKASSLISRADRRAQGKAKGKTTAPAKTKAHWDNIASRIGAFLKGLVSKFSRKSVFHHHLLHPDEEAPVVPLRPDTYLPPSPRERL
ncbi:hypothetical protein M378DRAFT_159778, partial [Amanita muscaria Koide BX008]